MAILSCTTKLLPFQGPGNWGTEMLTYITQLANGRIGFQPGQSGLRIPAVNPPWAASLLQSRVESVPNDQLLGAVSVILVSASNDPNVLSLAVRRSSRTSLAKSWHSIIWNEATKSNDNMSQLLKASVSKFLCHMWDANFKTNRFSLSFNEHLLVNLPAIPFLILCIPFPWEKNNSLHRTTCLSPSVSAYYLTDRISLQ